MWVLQHYTSQTQNLNCVAEVPACRCIPTKQGLTPTQNHNSATNNNHDRKRGNTTDINLCFNKPSQIHGFLIAVAKEVAQQHHLRNWLNLHRIPKGRGLFRTSWFVIPSSGWQWFWFRWWLSTDRGVWLTCHGISSSHWAKPRFDALEGIIPHSGHQADTWPQGPDWWGHSAWPLGRSTAMAEPNEFLVAGSI